MKNIVKIVYLSFFILVFYTNTLRAEILKEIIITGNERISDETLIVYGEIQRNKNYTQDEINNIIKNLYDTKFFSKISINFSNGILKIIVEENPIINSITLQGEPTKKFTKALLNFMTLKEKSSYIKNDVKQDVEIIKEFYKDFSPEQISSKMSEMLLDKNSNVELDIIFQTVDNLHKACKNHKGDWYFTGNYPTPGGNKEVNQAFINFVEGKSGRAY